jgi:hypothetical protein
MVTCVLGARPELWRVLLLAVLLLAVLLLAVLNLEGISGEYANYYCLFVTKAYYGQKCPCYRPDLRNQI